jgi:hypothetical protein
MKSPIHITLPLAVFSMVLPASAYAHTGAGAVHDFNLAGAIWHVLISPDHLMPFILAALAGGVFGAGVLVVKGRNKRR